MKLHFLKSPFILVLALSLGATSCLKDKAFENGSIQSGSGGSGVDIKVISLGLTVSSASYQYTDYNGNSAAYAGVQFLQTAYPLDDNDTTVNLIPVELGGLAAASQDIHVTLTQDDGLVATYNDSTGSAYTNPGSNITIIDSVVTIPKGSRIGYLQIKFKPTNLLNGTFAYGFKIASIAESGYTISGNLSAGVVGIGPKNQYDGVYSSAGEFVHPSLGDQIWDNSKGLTQALVTSGLSSVYTSPISTPAALFGVTLSITINPDNTLVEVFNGVTTPTPNSDHYDPATKTFYVSGSYMGGSGPRKYNATYVYVKSR
ncbi:MAG: DUF1735 domain-containing protein [Ginsengibacter sp.]